MTILFETENAQQVDNTGAVSMTITVKENGILVRSYPMYVQVDEEVELAYKFAKQWVIDNPSDIAAFIPDSIEQVRENSILQLAGMLSALPQSILSRYPEVERELWQDYEREAKLFIASGGANVGTDYPTLLQMLAVKLGPPADAAAALVQLSGAVPGIRTNAGAWRAIATYVSGARARISTQIDAATTELDCINILAAAEIEIAQVKAQYGL